MFYPSQDYAPIGSLKARYRPLGLVAQGQFGKVYCAVHRSSGRLVALKLLDRQRSTTSQFLRELSSLLTLSHPALTQLHAIEQTDAGRCLVLDYSAGGTLRQLLESTHVPCQEQLLKCLGEVLAGLDHAHRRGIVHCDVKPENILIQLAPQGWRACLTDFGIAQSDVMGSSPEFERGGSPAYMAPERFDGQACPASDLYSMGIILHEVLLGDRPFHGGPNQLREAHRQGKVAFSQPVPMAFQVLIHRALGKTPELRYHSARSMAQDLQQALEGQIQKTQIPKTQPLKTRAPKAPDPEGYAPPRPASRQQARTPDVQTDVQPKGRSLFPPMAPQPRPWPPGTAPHFLAFAPSSRPNSSVQTDAILTAISPFLMGSERGNGPAGPAQRPGRQPSEQTKTIQTPQLWLARGSTIQGVSLALEPSQTAAEDETYLTIKQMEQSLSLALPEAVTALALSHRYGFATTATALYRWPLAILNPEPEGSEPGSPAIKSQMPSPLATTFGSDPLGGNRPRADRLRANGLEANSLKANSLEANSLEANRGEGNGLGSAREIAHTQQSQLFCLSENLSDLSQVILAPQGEWGTLVQRSPQGPTSLLTLGLALGRSGDKWERKWDAMAPQRKLPLHPSETLAAVLLLDRRHGAALVSSGDGTQRLGLFSRRGQWLSSLPLPVPMTGWVQGTLAYELWALERDQPQILLRLGLKPFRIERIPVAIAPDQIHPLPWGCVLANQQGQILLLNREGQSLGQLQIPLLSGKTQRLWIVVLKPYLLTVVIQQARGLKLLPLDLRDLELMLVF